MKAELKKHQVTLSRPKDTLILGNQIPVGSNRKWHLHRHQECEVCYFPSDSGYFLYEDFEVPFQAGDLFLNAPNRYHHPVFEHSDNQGLVVLYFHPRLLAETPSNWLPLLRLLNAKEKGYCKLSNNADAIHLVFKTLRHFQDEKPNWQILCQGSLLNLLSHFAQDAASQPALASGQARSESEAIQRAVTFIRDHFAEEIPATELYRVAGMSRTRFCHHFKKACGISARQFIEQVRIAHAEHLLASTELSVSEIAYTSGFAWISRFNRSFKARTGKTPSEYRLVRN